MKAEFKVRRWIEQERRFLLSALFFFTLAAFCGIVLRSAFVINLPETIDYRYWRHGHSHLALLGWLHAMLLLGIIRVFGLASPFCSRLLYFMQVAVGVMWIGFLRGGYDPFSIFFLVIHVIVTVIIVIKIWQEINKKERSVVHQFLKAAIVWLFLSDSATLALGPLMQTGLKGSIWYYGTIQFYLHFQFNGWLLFGVLAIFLKILENKGISLPRRRFNQFFWILTAATISTFALAISWSTPRMEIFLTNSIGVVLQLVALIMGYLLVRPYWLKIKVELTRQQKFFILVFFISLVLKVFMQTLVVFPFLATVSYTIRTFIVGFVHLQMLGVYSFFFFFLISYVFGLHINRSGVLLFFTGLLVSEGLLFFQGLFLWQRWGLIDYYYLSLFLASVVMFLGIVWIFLDQFIAKPKHKSPLSSTTIKEN